MKIQQLSNGQFFVCLPRQIVRAKEWKKGDRVKILIDTNGDLRLRKE